jgi:hypothetical protein
MSLVMGCRVEEFDIDGQRATARLFGRAGAGWLENGVPKFAVRPEAGVEFDGEAWEQMEVVRFDVVKEEPPPFRWRRSWWGGLLTTGSEHGPMLAWSAQRRRWGVMVGAGALLDISPPGLLDGDWYDSEDADNEVFGFVMLGRSGGRLDP